jgi:shikimate dehydrogenase
VSRFALLGDPVAHSKSPRMHAAAYRALGMPHTYEAIRVAEHDLARYVALLRDGTFGGFNVTVPHKRAVLARVDRVYRSAAACGAANTLVCDAGAVVAHNTDAPALAVEIRRLAPGLATKPGPAALVLGTGGAARAAVAALAIDLGIARVVVRGRGKEQAFAAEMRPLLAAAGARARLDAEPWAPRAETEREIDVVVQATSAGMEGGEPGEAAASAVAWADLAAAAVALDVVYAPADTPFLRAAAARGLDAASGLGMLARQGALAFELWLGVPAPYDAMLAALSP